MVVVDVAKPDAVLVVQDKAMFAVWVEQVVDEVPVAVLVLEVLEEAPVVPGMVPPEAPTPPPTHSHVLRRLLSQPVLAAGRSGGSVRGRLRGKKVRGCPRQNKDGWPWRGIAQGRRQRDEDGRPRGGSYRPRRNKDR